MQHRLRGHYPSRSVWLDGQCLDPAPSIKVKNHSPDGFNWGYGGSGPAQLALAIVLHLTDSPTGYQDFKNKIIAGLPQGKSFDIDFEYPEIIKEG